MNTLKRLTSLATAACAILASGTAQAQYSAQVLADNPIVYYQLNETTGTTALNSSSLGAAMDASYVGMGTGTGPFNLGQVGPRAGDLAGSFVIDNGAFPADNLAPHFGANEAEGANSSRIERHSPAGDTLAFNGSTGFTLEAWILLDPHTASSANDNEGIISRYMGRNVNGSAINQRSYLLYYDDDDNTIAMTLGSATGTNVTANVVAYAGIPFGQWLHVAATYEPGVHQRLFLNGEMVAERTTGVPTSIYAGASEFYIGRQFSIVGDPAFSFEGQIDDVAVYGSALSPERLAAHYEAATVDTPTSFAWSVNASGNWDEATNWSFNTAPNSNAQSAVFGGAISEPRVVYTNSGKTIANLAFATASGYTIAGPGSLTFSAAEGSSAISVVGNHQIATQVSLDNDVTIDAASGTLSLSGPVNLNGHNMEITGGTLNLMHSVTSSGGSLITNSGTLGTAGMVNIEADLVSTGVIDIDIAGTGAGEVDFLNIEGTATLSGTLSAELFNGFVTTGTETFTVLTATNLVDNGIALGGPAAEFFRLLVVDNSLVLSTSLGLEGDFNGDGVVDAADYTVWRNNLGAADETALGGNGDGLNGVDAGDYALWKANFGQTAAAASLTGAGEVPEPATFWLLALGGMAVMGWRRCQRRASVTLVPQQESSMVAVRVGVVSLAAALGAAGTTHAQYSAAVLADNPVVYYSLNEEGDGLTFFSTNSSTTPGLDAAIQNIGNFGDVGPNNIGQVGPRPGDYAGGRIIDGFSANNRSVHFGPASSSYGRLEVLDDQVSPNPLDITGSLTLEAWVNRSPATDGGSNEGILTKFVGSGNNRSYNLYYDPSPGRVGFVLSPTGTSAANVELTSPIDLAIGEWTYVAATYDQAATTMSLYMNGQLVASRNDAPASIFEGTAPLWIGHQFNTSTASTFEGRIDEAAVYDRALSSAEILAHFEAAVGAPLASYQWGINGSGNWADFNNWAQPSVPNRDDAAVVFGNVITSQQTVFNEDEVRANSITFDSPHTYAIAGIDEVVLRAESGNASLHVEQGNHLIQAPVRLDADTDVTMTSGSLEFNNQLNLNGHDLIVGAGASVEFNHRVLSSGGGAVVNAGSLMIAAPASMEGDFDNEGALMMALDGGSGGEAMLRIAGKALLGGTFVPEWAPGGGLAVGESMALLTAGSLVDNGITLGGGLAPYYSLSVMGNQLMLTATAVPEPGAISLALLGLVTLGVRHGWRASQPKDRARR